MVTFIIGNGFDIQVGLKTRYTDFYKAYIKPIESDSENIRRFKKEILKSEAHNWKDWADFELQMGKHTKDFGGDTPVEDFIECFDNFVVCFNEYLIAECKSINWDDITALESMYRNFNISITNFYTHILRVDRKIFTDLIAKEATVNFVQFNYTDAFDKLLSQCGLIKNPQISRSARAGIVKYGDNLHVHGKLGSGGYMTMGVDDETQIENEDIKNAPKIRNILVKPKFLDALQSRNVNQESVRTKAQKVINGSRLICTFGCSIGKTDGYWWKLIGDWLKKSNGVLVIFDRCGASDDGISPLAFLNSELNIDERRTEIMERFLELSELNADWLVQNPKRIVIELDTKMFDFKLPRINSV